MTDEPEKKCPFRAVGFKPEAADYPRDGLALIMLAAFNNVPVDKLTEGMRYFPNESTEKAWTRVAEAARAHPVMSGRMDAAVDELSFLAELALKHGFTLVAHDNYDELRRVYRRWWWAGKSQLDPADPEPYNMRDYGAPDGESNSL